jgi:hypothetical protein
LISISVGVEHNRISAFIFIFRSYFPKGPSNKTVGMKGLDHLTDGQVFWLAFARNWCQEKLSPAKDLSKELSNLSNLLKEKDTDQDDLSEVAALLKDPHSLNEYRVLGPVTSVKEFAQDWNCPAGSNHFPGPDRCKVPLVI